MQNITTMQFSSLAKASGPQGCRVRPRGRIASKHESHTHTHTHDFDGNKSWEVIQQKTQQFILLHFNQDLWFIFVTLMLMRGPDCHFIELKWLHTCLHVHSSTIMQMFLLRRLTSRLQKSFKAWLDPLLSRFSWNPCCISYSLCPSCLRWKSCFSSLDLKQSARDEKRIMNLFSKLDKNTPPPNKRKGKNKIKEYSLHF